SEREQKGLLAKMAQGQQRLTELEKRLKTEQATAAEARHQLEAARQSSPADAAPLQKQADELRGQLEQVSAELGRVRQQNDQRGQGWTVEKKSLLAHHQEEYRRLTEEFEQRLKAELARCREGFDEQFETLQRERDSARADFEKLRQAVYHPVGAA